MSSANLVFRIFSPGPAQEKEKRDPWNELGQRSSYQFQYIYLCLKVLMKRTFFILFERAFKRKIDVYFIVIVLLGAELFKV